MDPEPRYRGFSNRQKRLAIIRSVERASPAIGGELDFDPGHLSGLVSIE